jgi:hypothetical protein
MVGIPAALFAKAEIVKITITGADLATPLEIVLAQPEMEK